MLEAIDAANDKDYFAPGIWNGDVRRWELTGELPPQEYATISAAKDSSAG